MTLSMCRDVKKTLINYRLQKQIAINNGKNDRMIT